MLKELTLKSRPSPSDPGRHVLMQEIRFEICMQQIGAQQISYLVRSMYYDMVIRYATSTIRCQSNSPSVPRCLMFDMSGAQKVSNSMDLFRVQEAAMVEMLAIFSLCRTIFIITQSAIETGLSRSRVPTCILRILSIVA